MVEHLTNTIVKVLERDTVVLCKLDEKANLHKTYVCNRKDLVLAFSVLNCKPIITCVKKYTNEVTAYQKWLALIGELSVKDITSKFFKNAKESDDFKNSNYDLSEEDKEEVTKFAVEIYNKYN